MNWISQNRPARKLLASLLLCAAVTSLSGCAEFLYESLHDDGRNQCDKLVNTDERAACIKRYQQSFNAYEKERVKLLKSK